MSQRPIIPSDVAQAVRSIFAAANTAVSRRLDRHPACPEVALDTALIDELNLYGAPFYTNYSNSLVRVTTHFLGGGWHWGRWEIADIGFIIEVFHFGKPILKKIACLQSKRLYAVDVESDFERELALRRAGFGGLQSLFNPLPAEAHRDFQFTRKSKYLRLEVGGEQDKRIADYEGEYGIPIHYQLYNPTDIPLRVTVPAAGLTASENINLVGARILRAATIRTLPCGAPTFDDVDILAAPHDNATWAAGWRLEDFVLDLCLGCHEGYVPTNDADLGLEFLFNRRTAPIQAAVSVQIDVRAE